MNTTKFGIYDDCQKKWLAHNSDQRFPAFESDVANAKVFDTREDAIDFKVCFPMQVRAFAAVTELPPLSSPKDTPQ